MAVLLVGDGTADHTALLKTATSTPLGGGVCLSSSAIKSENLPIHPFALRARQETDDSGDIYRISVSVQWRGLGSHLLRD